MARSLPRSQEAGSQNPVHARSTQSGPVSVAGGWQHRTKKVFGDLIHAALGTAAGEGAKELPQSEALVLMCIAYFQPITRGELSSFFGKEVSARSDRRAARRT